jgi:T-complex protein 1 subunit eta
MVVSAVERLDINLQEKEMIGIKHVTGGSIQDSMLIDGVAFKKTFSYAGFEQQPKKFANPKIILLNVELELKAEKENAEVRVDRGVDFQAIVDAEWQIIYSKLDLIVKSEAKIVLSSLPIGDLATQYFADRNIFCAGRVKKEDMNRVAMATGSRILSTVSDILTNVIGSCGEFEEMQVGAERFNFFKHCKDSKTATIILRGGSEQFVKEADRSLNDAIMIVRRVIKTQKIVPGGGAVEMELSKLLRNYSREIRGKEQVIINAFAKSLEAIPRCLAENAGFDSNDIISKLRKHHAADDKYFGVNVWDEENAVCDTYASFVWEPLLIKKNYISSANEAACLILSIDETIKAPQNEEDQKMRKQPLPGMGPQGMKFK